jgi:hypothetical protein
MPVGFNPVVRTLRFHWFSARPCLEFLLPASLSEFGAGFLHPDCYYSADQTHECVTLKRLGRRSLAARTGLEGKELTPHRFWSVYMSKVAGPDYRGFWNGLAPMRLAFRDQPPQRLVRISPTFSMPESAPFSGIKVFPNCYLTPIGWVAGIVVEIKSNFTLDRTPALVRSLRTEAAFQFLDHPVTLETLFKKLHETIRRVLILPVSQRDFDWPRPYLVASPIHFDRQRDFHGRLGFDLNTILQILDEDADFDEKPALVRRNARVLALTLLNRGSFLMAQAPEDRPSAPRCALSNLKNSLLVITLMHRFHKAFRGHRSLAAQNMCDEVEKTLKQLQSSWEAPHFHQIFNAHTGIRKMVQRQYAVEYRFDNAKIFYPAIGDNAQVVAEPTTPIRKSRKERQMSSFTFNNNTMTNNAIGDHATIVQNLDAATLSQLGKVSDVAAERASTDDEKADAARLKEAAAEAEAGRKEGAVAHLRQLGSWGWSLMKEVISGTAAELIKKAVVGS